MKAAIVMAAGRTPIYGDFEKPVAQAGEELIVVRAAALSNLTRMRATGSHYSADGVFPAVAGTDGVGVTQDGMRVYFALPEAPFGSLAEFCPVRASQCVEIPASVDDILAAAIANPGMSAWTALVERAHLVAGETVLINGATGTAGRIAVRVRTGFRPTDHRGSARRRVDHAGRPIPAVRSGAPPDRFRWCWHFGGETLVTENAGRCHAKIDG